MDDKQERNTIVTSLDKNYFVEASAGSGKTTSLVFRMVALIESGVPINEICTITFTKAAADEFFARFQRLLSVRSINLPDDSDKYLGEKSSTSTERCQKALENIDLCFLGTIDAFLNMVAHELPNEIGVPSDCEVIDNDKRALFIKLEYDSLLSDVNNPLHECALRFNDVFGYLSYKAFASMIDKVLSKRNTNIIYDKSLLNINMDDYLKEYKDDLLNILKTFSDNPIRFDFSSGKGKDRHMRLRSIINSYNYLKHHTFDECIRTLGDIVKSLKHSDLVGGYPASEVEGTPLETNCILERKTKQSYTYTQDVLDLLTTVDNKINDYKHTLLLYLTIEASKQLSEKLKQSGKFTFDDFLYYCLLAFKKSASTDRVLVDHILARHSHFLLDESQDTNPMQTEIFFYITGTKKDNDWTKIEPREGSLFIVGDPKQSIYGFRGANVQAYLKTKALFEAKQEVLILTNNFRSLGVLKTWFNDSMDDILKHGEDALTHNKIPPNENELMEEENTIIDSGDIGLKGVYKYCVDNSKDPEYIASTIYELVNNKKYKILVKNPAKDAQKPYIYRNIAYKDFLVVPRQTKISEYIKAFNEYNIPLIIEASIPFDNSPSLIALNRLSILMKTPYDRAALLDVFYNFYNLNDEDIIKLVNDNFNFDITDVSELIINDERLKNIILELNRLFVATRNLSFSSTLLYLLNDKGLQLLKKVDSSNLEYAYFLIEKVKEQEETGDLSSVSRYKEFVSNFSENKTDENRILRFKDKIDRVKVANLHKVKGLQAPIVILIRPSIMMRKVTSFVDYTSNPVETHYQTISITGENNDITLAKSSKYDEAVLNRWNAFDEAERDRLEYVAATRAESVLLVSEPMRLNSNYYNPWGKLVSHISDENRFGIDCELEVPIIEPIDVSYIEPSIKDACHNLSVKYHSPSNGRIKLVNNNDDEMDEGRDDATIVGTLIHKLMECLISSHNSYDDIDTLINNIVYAYGERDYASILKNVADKIIGGGFTQKNSQLPNDILGLIKNSKVVYCELPFSYKKYGVIVSGIIDLLYKDDNGYHIIDYKTNQEDDVSILEKEYQKQLSDYQEALKEIGIEADVHIYHIDVK